MLKELALIFRLKRSADHGIPLILVVRPDRTMDLVFPQARRNNLVWYVDPATKRREIVILRPEAVFHLGRALILVHVQGYLESLGWRELGSLLFASPNTVQRLRERLRELTGEDPGGNIIRLADVWRDLRARGIINNIPPPDVPAFIALPERILATLEDFRTAVLAESMSYVKQVTGLQGLLGARGSWWLILLLAAGGLLLLLMLGGMFHPAPTHPAPIKT